MRKEKEKTMRAPSATCCQPAMSLRPGDFLCVSPFLNNPNLKILTTCLCSCQPEASVNWNSKIALGEQGLRTWIRVWFDLMPDVSIFQVSMLSIRYGDNWDKDFALEGFTCRERESGSREQVKMMQLMINVVCVLGKPWATSYLGAGKEFA